MPEKYVTDSEIRLLSVNEVIVGWGPNVPSDAPIGVISEIEAKRDYTYFKVDSKQKQWRLHNNAVARVRRERMTAEEQTVYRRKRALEELDAAEEQAARRVATSRQEIMDRFAEGKRISSFEYDRLLQTEAVASLYEELTEYHKLVSLRLAFDGPIERRGEIIEQFTRFDAMREISERCIKQLIENGRFTNHVSGSGMDGVIKSYHHQAMADFANEVRSPFGHFSFD